MTRSLLIILAAVAALALFVLLAETLLLLFGAILVAAVLDVAVRGVQRILPVPRMVALLVVIGISVITLATALALGGWTLVSQFEDLLELLGEAWQGVDDYLQGWGIYLPKELDLDALSAYGPDATAIFGRAGAALGTTFGFVGNAVVLLLIGIFLAVNPAGYRNGVLRLFPRERRQRLREVLDRTGETLRWWLGAQLLLMVIIGVSTSILLLVMGIPYALLLGVLAGLLNFIPFLGPILAMVPIFLAVMGQDATTILIVLGVYAVIQQVEGNVLAPLIQQKVVHLAPALNIAFLVVMGVLFGGAGVALATPLLAALRVLVLELYLRDVLGDDPDRSPI